MIKPNVNTTEYLNSNIKGYVNKSIGIDKFEDEIKEKYRLDKIISLKTNCPYFMG